MVAGKRPRGRPRKKRGTLRSKLRMAYRSRIYNRRGKQVVHRHFRWMPYEQRINITIPAAAAGSFNPGINTYSLAYYVNQLSNFLELSQLYDQYKIARTYLRVNYNTNIAASATGFTHYGQGLEMLIGNDYDDINPPTYNEMAQKSTTKRVRFTDLRPTHKWKCRPKVLQENYKTALLTGYSTAKAPWVDFQNADLPHYGTKMVFLNYIAAEVSVSIDVGMIVLCRGTR